MLNVSFIHIFYTVYNTNFFKINLKSEITFNKEFVGNHCC